MAHILLRIDLPDDDERVVNYGISALAEDAANDLAGWNCTESHSYTVVEAVGPDDPTRCFACGCDPHPGKACPDCEHPFCLNPEGPS